jgi:hypothetical protein
VSLPPPIRAEVLPKDWELARCTVSAPGGLFGEHMARLRALPAHGNRDLHMDQLFHGLLLAFYDPMVRSLRTLADKGNFGGRLDLSRLARSTTADALAVFDPAQLKPIIDDLRERVPHLKHTDTDLLGITRQIIAADGTYLTTLADVAWALHQTKRNGRRHGQVRANVQMDVATWTPQVLTISGDDDASEPAAFARDLLSGVLYVVDRNFLDFGFLSQLLAKDNDFVLRVRSNAPATKVLDTLALTAADVEAGVIADEIVELTGSGAPPGRFRRVTITTINRKGEPEIIRLLSNLSHRRPGDRRDLPATLANRAVLQMAQDLGADGSPAEHQPQRHHVPVLCRGDRGADDVRAERPSRQHLYAGGPEPRGQRRMHPEAGDGGHRLP